MPGAHQLQLGIQFKKTEAVDIKAPLILFIRTTYSDREADEALDDLLSIQRLRGEIAAAQNGSQPVLRDTMTKYLRCLTAVETRFPISKEKSHAQVSFPWFDAFRPGKRMAQFNIHYEKAAVLFNLAAALSQQALACDRSAPEGLKTACQLFQEAAGTFMYMRENEVNKTDAPRSADFSVECVSMLEKLMLAQAQEAMYNRVRLEGKTSASTLARLAKQATIMYGEAERLLGAPGLIAYFDKSWLAHVQMKASLYDVECLVQYAKTFRVNDDVNIEICVLTEAFKRLQNTKKLTKAISAEMYETTKVVQDTIQLALSKAEKDNNTIYLKRVPAFLDQAEVQGALLVKPVPPLPAALDASQEQLFVGLVPDTSAKALSKYSDMVDSLIREEVGRLAGATDAARLRLKEWALPDSLEALDVNSNASLPDALMQELGDIEGIGGVSHLREILSEVGELRKSVDDELVAARTALEGEQAQDAEARSLYGDAWNAPPSATLAKPYWDRIATYRSSMQKASDSDQGVMRRLMDSDAAFANLRVDSAAMMMPRLQAPLINTSGEDPVRIVADLRRNLDLLQSLAAERAGMEEALQDLKKKDNILHKLMACGPPGQDALFAAELQKYDTLRADVAKNCKTQEEVLRAVDRDNKLFRHVFDLAGWRSSCDRAAVSTRDQARSFRELLDHLSEGLRFYIGMGEVVKKARQECQDFAFTRSVQRDELKQDLSRRAQQQEAEKLSRQMLQANLYAQHPANVTYPQAPPPAHYPAPHQQPPPVGHGGGSFNSSGSFGHAGSFGHGGPSPEQLYGQQTPHQAYYGVPQASQPAPHYGYGQGGPPQPQQPQYTPHQQMQPQQPPQGYGFRAPQPYSGPPSYGQQ